MRMADKIGSLVARVLKIEEEKHDLYL